MGNCLTKHCLLALSTSCYMYDNKSGSCQRSKLCISCQLGWTLLRHAQKKVNQLQNGSILSHILSKVTEILEQQCNTLESQTTVNLENHINPGAWFSFQSYHSIKHLECDYWHHNHLNFNLLTHMSGQDRISPHNINEIPSRQVMRIKKNIN